VLVLRNAQLEAIGRVPRLLYEKALLKHFGRYYPAECERAGQEQVLELIEYGIERAPTHGYESQREVAFYVNLMLILGCDFDLDPQYPWAGEQLNDFSITDPFARIQRVFQTTIDFLNKTSGDGNEYVLRALHRMRQYDLETPPHSLGGQPESHLMGLLQSLYPEKCAWHTSHELAALIRHSTEAASRHGFQEAAGQSVYTTLVFMLGVGIDHDPMYPWAGRTLNDATIRGERARVEELHREAIAYIDFLLPKI
jgi:hypothetical protein